MIYVEILFIEFKGTACRYIPTGVLFDLLCAEPERPWNLTVHFRGYPGNLLIPCEGEDSVKWSFINSLKEAAYIINGNCKNVMNMSQSDQVDLWQSVMNGNLDAFLRVSSKLKLGKFEDEYSAKTLCSPRSRHGPGEADMGGQMKTGRIPVRLYVWSVNEDFDDFDDVPQLDSWDKISYINRPVEILREEGKYFSLHDAIRTLLPEYFVHQPVINDKTRIEGEEEQRVASEDAISNRSTEEGLETTEQSEPPATAISSNAELKIVRIQGIEPKLEIPFSWVVNNLMNPEHFLHICVCLKVP
ncbi:Autophagy protein Apg5 family isoform 2 [Tripterygium wilfordii]|uniref:Autophagy protein 5 n=1 Tax=Tripterygium wilfordii TaxID=458696 RepID=A0A7J7CUB2_TRIWF|nr:Autophagy protein Apg5 family isoform 2 [Tripterygium wilfordii]